MGERVTDALQIQAELEQALADRQALVSFSRELAEHDARRERLLLG